MKLSKMIQAVDLHACGQPGRVIVGGVLDVPGASMFEKMQYVATEADDLRKRMLREPRGYPLATCNLILPPTHPEADAGFVIMEQVEYPPVNGGGIMLHARRPGGPVAAAQNCATHGPLSVATRGRRCTAWSSMRRFDWRLSTRV